MNEKLQHLMSKNDINGTFLSFKETTHTAADAAKLLHCETAQIIKSLIVIGKDNNNQLIPLLVLVPGNRKLKQSSIRKVVNANSNFDLKDSKLASPSQVFEYTGYEVGSVPPILEGMRVIMDQSILDQEMVYGGGGSTNSLLEISVSELRGFSNPIVGVISEIN